MPSGKAKRAALQERRQRDRERRRVEDEQPSSSSAGAATRLPAVVQCRCYTVKEHRGAPSTVRLKLSIDRQLCVGFGGPRANRVTPNVVLAAIEAAAALEPINNTPPPPPPPPTPAVIKKLAARAAALQAKLSGLAKLKSAGEVEREWAWSINSAVQIFEAVSAARADSAAVAAADELARLSRGTMFMIAQQALQTGPLSFGKPAQFKRFAKSLQSERMAHSFGHPHARAVRRLLDVMVALLPVEPAAEVTAHGGGSDDDDEGEVVVVNAHPAAAGEQQLPPQEGGTPARMASLFSEKQCASLRAWDAEFARAFSFELGGDAAASRAGVGRRLGGDQVRDAANLEEKAGPSRDVRQTTPARASSSTFSTTSAMTERELQAAALARRGL